MNVFPLGLVIPAALAFAACGVVNRPISSEDFDPLSTPGSDSPSSPSSYGPVLTPGSFVTANIPNTVFYKNKPRGNADADKLLDRGTNMKIVSIDPEHVKVELDNGEVGWVPSVMVASANAAPENHPIDGAYQVYPPLPSNGPVEPLPIIDPSGLPPEGAIPTIIDPDTPFPADGDPIKIDPVPDLKPTEPEAVPEAAENADAEKAGDTGEPGETDE